MELLVRALSEPTRRSILDFLHDHANQEVTVDELVKVEHVHRSVAFDHLEMLADAGLIERGQREGPRGRPARTYAYRGTSIEFSYPQRQHQLLATILSKAMRGQGAKGVRAARLAGRRAGMQLASGGRGTAGAARTLATLGGEYEVSRHSIHAGNCVFLEACAAGDMACVVHAGIIEGALESAGVIRIVKPFGGDGEGGCWYRLEARK
jgi:predicted ArsR family transcriptional regulator